MNADDVTRALVRGMDIRRTLTVRNVSWGFVQWGECDLLALSNAGYLTEYEIKVKPADIYREWNKKRWGHEPYRRAFDGMIRRYYMVVPQKIQAVAEFAMPEDVGGGVIVADFERPNHPIPGTVAHCVKAARVNKKARKLNDKERLQLARLGTMRYWSRFLKE